MGVDGPRHCSSPDGTSCCAHNRRRHARYSRPAAHRWVELRFVQPILPACKRSLIAPNCAGRLRWRPLEWLRCASDPAGPAFRSNYRRAIGSSTGRFSGLRLNSAMTSIPRQFSGIGRVFMGNPGCTGIEPEDLSAAERFRGDRINIRPTRAGGRCKIGSVLFTGSRYSRRIDFIARRSDRHGSDCRRHAPSANGMLVRECRPPVKI